MKQFENFAAYAEAIKENKEEWQLALAARDDHGMLVAEDEKIKILAASYHGSFKGE